MIIRLQKGHGCRLQVYLMSPEVRIIRSNKKEILSGKMARTSGLLENY